MKAVAVLEAKDVIKRYGDVTALKGISLTLNEGEILALLGPNGAGKTTLINIISGVIEPTSGEVRIEGLPPKNPNARAKIGLMPQEHSLYGDLTGIENLVFYARLYGLEKQEISDKIPKLLKRVGLGDAARRLVKTYSGGMKKRLSLAAALLNDPKILILDEPTTGMDPGMRVETWKIIREAKESGKAILLATHYMDEADALADRVAIINSGAIIAEGTPEELKRKYGPKSVVEVELWKPLKDAAKIIEGIAESVTPSEDEMQLIVHVSDPDSAVPEVVTKLHTAGAAVRSLKVRKPTLEDVFLKLTGRRLGE